MAIQIRRATREALKLKIGIDGPSGSGKTEGMLALLTGLTNGGRILVADSENESASYYADRYNFDTTSLPGDTTARQVREIIRESVSLKYDGLGIDSTSRVWTNILAAKDAYDLAHPTANKWTTWGREEFGPSWDAMMKDILNAPIHIVATMRSKQAHEQITKDNGKKEVVKLGLQPQVRDGAEYEFGIVFSVNMNHYAEATKDRTNLFKPGDMLDLRSPELHTRLVKWMNSETPATVDAVASLVALAEDAAVSDAARKAVGQLIADGNPSAGKVARYAERLAVMIAAAKAAPANDPTPAAA